MSTQPVSTAWSPRSVSHVHQPRLEIQLARAELLALARGHDVVEAIQHALEGDAAPDVAPQVAADRPGVRVERALGNDHHAVAAQVARIVELAELPLYQPVERQREQRDQD